MSLKGFFLTYFSLWVPLEGCSATGPEGVDRMIMRGSLKQWTKNGVAMVGYLGQSVTDERENRSSLRGEQDRFFFCDFNRHIEI